jgi:hypothetical protein
MAAESRPGDSVNSITMEIDMLELRRLELWMLVILTLSVVIKI